MRPRLSGLQRSPIPLGRRVPGPDGRGMGGQQPAVAIRPHADRLFCSLRFDTVSVWFCQRGTLSDGARLLWYACRWQWSGDATCILEMPCTACLSTHRSPRSGRISADVAHERTKDRTDRCLSARDCRHRVGRDSDRPAFWADLAPHRPFQKALEGLREPPRAAHDGQSSSSPARLSQACRAAAVPRHHQAFRDS